MAKLDAEEPESPKPSAVRKVAEPTPVPKAAEVLKPTGAKKEQPSVTPSAESPPVPSVPLEAETAAESGITSPGTVKAVPVIIGAEVPTFLQAVNQMAHQVQIQDDLIGLLGQATNRQLQDRVADLDRIVAQLVIAGGLGIAQLQTVQRAGRRQGLSLGLKAIQTQRIGLARSHRQKGIQPQRGMIIEILVTQGQGMKTLGNQLFQTVIHKPVVPPILEAAGQSTGDTQRSIDLTHEQRTGIAGEMATGEIRHDFA